jgi:hypothetical protein
MKAFKKYPERKKPICKCGHYSFHHKFVGDLYLDAYGRCKECLCPDYDEILLYEDEIQKMLHFSGRIFTWNGLQNGEPLSPVHSIELFVDQFRGTE